MDEEIDVNKLRKELGAAVQADDDYWRENEAKFRAVRQKVSSYEEFRDIVKAAHLQPLEKKDLTGVTPGRQPWNVASTVERTQPTPPSTDGGVLVAENKPRNCQEFLRQWRTLGEDMAAKYSLLIDMGPAQLHKFFSVEISMGILGELVTVLNKQWNNSHSAHIVSILEILSSSQRFNLSVKFLSQQEKKEVRLKNYFTRHYYTMTLRDNI
ncbi:coiled-coil domain-containing protein 103-like isoform X2 [Dysidea avara]|uniref:coiled-coil domain-containing protein 103-like isoform X2 n=1 Tax=Dysidea avara TaxID=196820 RepID=UPI003332FCB5